MNTEQDDRIRVANEQEISEFATENLEQSESTVGAPTGDETAALRGQVAELQDKYLRARAEVDNIARRAQQERIEAVRYGNADLLKSVLDVLDDLERTVAASAGESGPLVDGVKLIHDKLLKLLRDSGVEPIEALHLPFSPAEHAALLQQPSKEHAPGTVIQEVQRGYRFRDRVLRPAQVVVAAAADF